MSADFTPDKENVSSIGAFRFWCQKVLPLVYDDSLSYYELLCKVVNSLNVVIENTDKLSEGYTSLYAAFETLQGYVNDYFANLDISSEIDRKIDQMAADGFFDTMIQQFAIPISQKGAANGVATLDSDGRLVQIPSATEVGAAPAGYGLGVNSYTAITANEIDGLNKTGIYWYRDTNASIYEDPWGSGGMGWVIHIQGDGNNVLGAYQKYIPYNPTRQDTTGYGYCYLERRKSDVGWKPWEWINPPMEQGTVYRTTERFMDKPIYKFCHMVDSPLLASGVAQGGFAQLPYDEINIISIKALAENTQTKHRQAFPITGNGGVLADVQVQRYTDGSTLLQLISYADMTAWKCVEFVVEFTKYSD